MRHISFHHYSPEGIYALYVCSPYFCYNFFYKCVILSMTKRKKKRHVKNQSPWSPRLSLASPTCQRIPDFQPCPSGPPCSADQPFRKISNTSPLGPSSSTDPQKPSACCWSCSVRNTTLECCWVRRGLKGRGPHGVGTPPCWPSAKRKRKPGRKEQELHLVSSWILSSKAQRHLKACSCVCSGPHLLEPSPDVCR